MGSSKRIYKFYCQSRPTLTTTAETNRHQKTISGNPVCNAMFAIRIGEDAVNGKGSVRISTLVRRLATRSGGGRRTRREQSVAAAITLEPASSEGPTTDRDRIKEKAAGKIFSDAQLKPKAVPA